MSKKLENISDEELEVLYKETSKNEIIDAISDAIIFLADNNRSDEALLLNDLLEKTSKTDFQEKTIDAVNYIHQNVITVIKLVEEKDISKVKSTLKELGYINKEILRNAKEWEKASENNTNKLTAATQSATPEEEKHTDSYKQSSSPSNTIQKASAQAVSTNTNNYSNPPKSSGCCNIL